MITNLLALALCMSATSTSTGLRVVAIYMDDLSATGARIGREVLAPVGGGVGGATHCHIHILIQNPTPSTSVSGTVTLIAEDHTGCTNPLQKIAVATTSTFGYGVTDVTTPVTALGLSPAQFAAATIPALGVGQHPYSINSRVFDLTASVTPADPQYANDTTRINMDGQGVPDWLWNRTIANYKKTTTSPYVNGNQNEPYPIWGSSVRTQAELDLAQLGNELGFNAFLLGKYYSLNPAGLALSGNPAGVNTLLGSPGGYEFPAVSYSTPDSGANPWQFSTSDVNALTAFIHSMSNDSKVIAYSDPGVLSASATASTEPYNLSMASTLTAGPNPYVPLRAFETVNLASMWESVYDQNAFDLANPSRSSTDFYFLNAVGEPTPTDPNYPHDQAYPSIYEIVLPEVSPLPLTRYLSETAGFRPSFSTSYVNATVSDLSGALMQDNFDGVLADDLGRGLEAYDLPVGQTNTLYELLADAHLGSGLPLPGSLPPNSPFISIDWDSFGLTDPSWATPLAKSNKGTDWNAISKMCGQIRSSIKGSATNANPAGQAALISSDYFDVWSQWPGQAIASDMPSSDHYPLFSTKFAEMAYHARALTRKPFHTDNVQTAPLLEGINNVITGWAGSDVRHARAVEMALAMAQGSEMEMDGEALIDPTNGSAATQTTVQTMNNLFVNNPQLFDVPQGSVNSSPKELCYHSDPNVEAQIPLSRRVGLTLSNASNAGSGLGYGLSKIVATIYRQTEVNGHRKYVMFLVNTCPVTFDISPPQVTFNVTLPDSDLSAAPGNFVSPAVDGTGSGTLTGFVGSRSTLTGTATFGSLMIVQWSTVLGPANTSVSLNESLATSPWSQAQGNIRETCQAIGSNDVGTQGWTFSTGGPVSQSSVIGADGRIYFGSWDSNFYSVDPNNPSSSPYVQQTGSHTNGAPAVGLDGTVYIGNDDGQVWSVKGSTFNLFYTAGGLVNRIAIGPDGLVYVTGHDSMLHVLDPATGNELWNFTSGSYTQGVAFGQNGAVYVTTEAGVLEALLPPPAGAGTDPQAGVAWSYQAGGQVYGTPTVGPDGSIYFGCQDNNVYAVLPTGSPKRGWPFTTGGVTSNVAISGLDGTLYVGSEDKNLYAIRPDGTLRWTFPTNASGAVSCDGIAADGTIYVDAWGDQLYALDTTSSSTAPIVRWRFSVGEPVGGLAINSNGTIYASSNNGQLYQILPTS